MNYIEDLRKQVGHRPLIAVGAAVLLLDSNKRLLMMLRTDNHCWGIPGGMMELGESLEDTVRRETQEEIGVRLTDLQLLGMYSGPDLYYQYPNGDETYNISAAYLSWYDLQPIRLDPVEHSEYRFFELDAIPDAVSPPIRPILRDLILHFAAH